MPQMDNINFPEYMFAHKFLHTIEDNVGKQNSIKRKN